MATYLRAGNQPATLLGHDRGMARFLVVLFAALLAASTATASGKEKEEKPKTVGQYVDLSPVALPIVANGRLINYVFVSVRVVLKSTANTPKIREREPYFRDALVRAGHRTPFNSASDYTSIDEKKLEASLFREVVAIAGPRDIQSVKVLSQTPKTLAGLPKIGVRSGVSDVRP